MKSVFRGGLLLAVFAAGCGETPSPTSPTNRSLFSQELAGAWLGDLQIRAVSAGECVGDDLRASTALGGGFDEGTVTVTQAGTDVTATVRSITTGLSCSYAGTAGPSLFALSAVACNDREIFFQCSNGQTRILDLLGSTMNAFSRATTASGTVASSYNVSRRDEDGVKVPVAGLTIQYQFEAVRP